MPCDCRRTTYRYACRHKEREFLRCWRYELRNNFPCMTACVPICHAHCLWAPIDGVCDECYQFFVRAFGRRIAHGVSEKFLQYKEQVGLSKEAIKPEAVPFQAYIGSAELATIGAEAARRTRQPYRPKSPMRGTRPRTPSPVPPRQPPPVAVHRRHGERSASRSRTQPVSASAARHPKRRSPKKSPTRKPVPVPEEEPRTHNLASTSQEVQSHNHGGLQQDRYNAENQIVRYHKDARHNHIAEESSSPSQPFTTSRFGSPTPKSLSTLQI